MHRTDVDNLAWALGLNQVFYKGLRGEECTLKVKVQHSIVYLLGNVPEIHALTVNACVINEDIKFAKVLNSSVDQFLNVADDAQVCLNNQTLTTHRFNLCQGFFRTGRMRAIIVDNDISTFYSQVFRDRLPNTLATARDEDRAQTFPKTTASCPLSQCCLSLYFQRCLAP